MKKSNLVAMLLGTVSGVLFALGMCMSLIPQWDLFQMGVFFGSMGILLGLLTLIVWRIMEHKQPLRISRKMVLNIVVGIAGILFLGVGMCFSMVWNQTAVGIVIGIGGIAMLLCLIPLTKGIKD